MSESKRSDPAAKGRPFVVLIGLMGAGKTNVGRRLAKALDMPFIDTDDEIEKAAGCSIEDIFEQYGEEHFRDGERRVIQRLLAGAPAVMATGGGAFMDAETRAAIAGAGVSVWLRADVELLVKRTRRRNNRPLLKHGNRREVLQGLIDRRYPVYGEADIIVDIDEEPADATTERVLAALDGKLKAKARPKRAKAKETDK